jgi:hypothetical protein
LTFIKCSSLSDRRTTEKVVAIRAADPTGTGLVRRDNYLGVMVISTAASGPR